jgi:hypothetical protein
MKRVLLLVQRAQYNWGEDRPFQQAVLGSNAAAAAVCGWRHPRPRGNPVKAQPDTKADFWAHHYTAKRMIAFLDFSCSNNSETLKTHRNGIDNQINL